MSQLHGVDCSKQLDYYDKMKQQLQGSEIEEQQRSERNKNRREMSSSVPTVGRDGIPKFSGSFNASSSSGERTGTGNNYEKLDKSMES